MCRDRAVVIRSVSTQPTRTYHLCRTESRIRHDWARVLPEAEWIVGDALQYSTSERYDVVYGNPPFGKIKTSEAITGRYTGTEFEYKVITHGATLAPYGVWIVPQGSAGFQYSGVHCCERRDSAKYKKFVNDTGWSLEPGCGIDTSIYKDEWHGTSVVCEVVTVEY